MSLDKNKIRGGVPSMVEEATIPFGKYAGSRYSSLPDDYLAWAVGEAEEDKFKPPSVNAEIIAEWDRRRRRAK